MGVKGQRSCEICEQPLVSKENFASLRVREPCASLRVEGGYVLVHVSASPA